MPIQNNNLPLQLTSFIGREIEIEEIKRLLTTTRLLTLSGAGGAGKTRLSLKVATDLLDDFKDGVWFIELAPITDPALVPQTIAHTLGLHNESVHPILNGLKDYLRDKNLLLVLDNCEHLIDECAKTVDALVRHSPRIKIITTSRETMSIAGETIWRVPMLTLPDTKSPPSPETLSQSEAVRLFTDRALTAQPLFALTHTNAPAIAQICARLDGNPLAIELAAARVKLLPVDQIAVRLDDRFRLLNIGSRTAPPRQQTLRAVIDWSYGLFSPIEKMLFRRLAVFAGGWTLEAAEAICSGDELASSEILDALGRLVDKSLVIPHNRAARYHMLETIRQYAREKLIDAGELQSLQKRHCDFFVQLAETAEPRLKGPEAPKWMDRLESESDNIRAVFEFAMANDISSAVRLAWSLLMQWVRRGNLNEGHDIVLRLLAHSVMQEANRLRLQALKTIGYLQLYIKDTVATRAYYEEGLSIAKRLEDKKEIAFTLHGMGRISTFVHDYQAARDFLEQSVELYREIGDRWGEALGLFCLGDVMDALGEHEHGRALEEESLSIFRAIGDICDTVLPLAGLGRMARDQGDYARAVALYEECIETDKRIDDRIHRAIATLGFGYSVLKQGDYRRASKLYAEMVELLERRGTTVLFVQWLLPMAEIVERFGRPSAAAHLLGAATALHESILAKGSVSFAHTEMYDRISKTVRARLDDATFNAAWATGHAMNLDQAIEFALAESEIPESPDDAAPTPLSRQAVKEKFDGLTVREREVAALIAHGKSNREIADALVLSERTIEGHVSNILNKLGFNVRSQIAAWAVKKGLMQSKEK